jgi:hypothetical protein
MKTDELTFVASKKLSDKIKELQRQLELESPGEVLSTALSMLELSLGREVEFKDKNGSYKTSKFSKYNHTIELTEDGRN